MKYNIIGIITFSILFVLNPFFGLYSVEAETKANIMKSSNDPGSEAERLSELGTQQYSEGQYKNALQSCLKELEIRQSLNNPKEIARTHSNVGLLYNILGDQQKASLYYAKSLLIYNSIGDLQGKASTLSNIGSVYSDLGKKQKALEYYNQSLLINDSISDPKLKTTTLNNIGSVYNDLGEKQKALEYYNQSLLISDSIEDLEGKATTLHNIGSVYNDLGEKQKALEYYNQSLLIYVSIGDRDGQALLLTNMGSIYSALGDKRKALEHYIRSLPISKATGNLMGEAFTLNNIGAIHFALGDAQKASEYYSQSLMIFQMIGNRDGEAMALRNLGVSAAKEDRPELAIFLLKQSVNIKQSLRKDISGLSRSVQKTYTDSNANSYRILSSFLLEQERVLEAQQVLDLLKVEEIDDYFGNSKRGDTRTQQDVVYLRPEQQLLDKYNQRMKSAIQIGHERKQLQDLSQKGQTLTSIQQKRLIELDRLQTEVKGLFNQFIDSPEVQQLTAQLTRSGQEQISLNVFDKLRKNLSKLGNAALVYPLVLDDRIELIITTPDSPPLRRTVKIQRTQLNQAIIDFRDGLESPKLDPKPSSQKLYSLLIQPLEADLKQANIKTIIYAPDGPLRYIPLAALYDGKQWIAERFSVNNITAASLSDLSTSQPSALRVLAGAFANEKLSYKVQVGQQTSVFHGLPFAGKEVNALAATIPGTEKRIDQAFSLKTLKPSFPQYNVLHFATHAAFYPGRPEDSFILFGDGDRATLSSIEDWSLSGVDLVVLSACESGLGIESSPKNPKPDKTKIDSGVEILGLGYQFQQSGARATIASLWSVDDGGTQSLMSSFYKLLQKGNITKAEALRQAQVYLITGKGNSSAGIKNLAHPHYWAPFFLIGNGL
jgi:CHAT domain-containing protein/Tfp pilus assembly protein PilF